MNEENNNIEEAAVPGNEISEPAPALNLYQMNQSIIQNNQKPLSKYALLQKRNIINKLHRNTKSNYYMMLFRDIAYYTVFAKDNNITTDLGNEVLECLDHFEVYDINFDNDEETALEIWIAPDKNTTPMVGYLFPYDEGVVSFGG